MLLKECRVLTIVFMLPSHPILWFFLHYAFTFHQRSSSSVFLQKCRFLLISAHHLQSTGRVRIQAVLSTSAFLAGFCYFTGFILQHSSTCTHSESIRPHVI